LGVVFDQPITNWPVSLIYISFPKQSKYILRLYDIPDHVKYICKGDETINLDLYRNYN
jgi:hypothetical protein